MRIQDIAIAIFVVFLWASSLLVQKVAAGHMSMVVFNFYRTLMVVPLLIFCFRQPIVYSHYFLCSLFWNVLNLLFLGAALRMGVEAGISSFLILMNSLFGILFCVIFLGEKPKYNEVFGMGVAAMGVLSMTTLSSQNNLPLWGIVMLLGSAVSWGLGFTFIKKFKIGRTMGDNLWLSATSLIPLALCCLAMEGPAETYSQTLNLSTITLACIVYVSLISNVIASFLWINLSTRAASSTIMPFILLLPVFACILSWLFMGETYTQHQLLSGALIFTGVCITQVGFKWLGAFKRKAIEGAN